MLVKRRSSSLDHILMQYFCVLVELLGAMQISSAAHCVLEKQGFGPVGAVAGGTWQTTGTNVPSNHTPCACAFVASSEARGWSCRKPPGVIGKRWQP